MDLSLSTLYGNGSQNRPERLSRETRVEAMFEPNKLALFSQILEAGPHPHQLHLAWRPGLGSQREGRGVCPARALGTGTDPGREGTDLARGGGTGPARGERQTRPEREQTPEVPVWSRPCPQPTSAFPVPPQPSLTQVLLELHAGAGPGPLRAGRSGMGVDCECEYASGRLRGVGVRRGGSAVGLAVGSDSASASGLALGPGRCRLSRPAGVAGATPRARRHRAGRGPGP